MDMVPDDSFRGCISKVNVWHRTLDYNREIPVLFANPDNPIAKGLHLLWSDYLIMGGASSHRPSKSGDTVCEDGFGGTNCDQLTTG